MRHARAATGSCSGWRAGVGKTYRMLQEGPAGAGRGTRRRDRLPRAARPAGDGGARRRARGRAAPARRSTAALELEEMDVDAVIRRAPELALVDELAHTNAPGMRNEKRYQDIDEILDAGIDVISTVNVQHLESLNDAVFELTERPRPRDVPRPHPRRGRRGRARRPLAGGAAASGCAPARSTAASASRRRSRTSSASRTSARCASSRCARSPRTSSSVAAPQSLEPLSQQADRRARARARRAAAEVAADHAPRLALRPAARRRDRRALGQAGRDDELDAGGGDAARRAATARVDPRRPLPRGGGRRPRRDRPPRRQERGSTYVFVGTPDERGGARSSAGSLLSRMVRELPGIDIRVVADRADAGSSSVIFALLAGLLALVRRCSRLLASRCWRGVRRSRGRPRRSGCSCRSPAAPSTRPSSTPRSASPAPKRRRSCRPTC